MVLRTDEEQTPPTSKRQKVQLAAPSSLLGYGMQLPIDRATAAIIDTDGEGAGGTTHKDAYRTVLDDINPAGFYVQPMEVSMDNGVQSDENVEKLAEIFFAIWSSLF